MACAGTRNERPPRARLEKSFDGLDGIALQLPPKSVPIVAPPGSARTAEAPPGSQPLARPEFPLPPMGLIVGRRGGGRRRDVAGYPFGRDLAFALPRPVRPAGASSVVAGGPLGAARCCSSKPGSKWCMTMRAAAHAVAFTIWRAWSCSVLTGLASLACRLGKYVRISDAAYHVLCIVYQLHTYMYIYIYNWYEF